MQNQDDVEQHKHPATMLFIVFAVILSSIGAFMCLYGFRRTKKVSLSYSDSNSVIDYQICNVENSNPLIGRCEKQDVYIASLVDSVIADYRYIVDFSAPVSGDLNYQLVAVLTAYSGSSDDRAIYKEKEYPLSSVKTSSLHDQKTLMLEHNANIDYVEFSEIMNEFRHDQASASGVLNVELRVNGELEAAELPNKINFDSKIGMEMPLAEQDLDVKLKLANSNSANKEIAMDVEVGTPLRFAIGCAGLILIASSAVVIAHTGRSYNESHSYTQYEDNIQRLLDCYDSIIVAVRDMPDLRNLKINEVDDFEDLLDVYNAVHMPINFCQTDDTSVFIVINEAMAWRFTVYAADFEYNGDEEEEDGADEADDSDESDGFFEPDLPESDSELKAKTDAVSESIPVKININQTPNVTASTDLDEEDEPSESDAVGEGDNSDEDDDAEYDNEASAQLEEEVSRTYDWESDEFKAVKANRAASKNVDSEYDDEIFDEDYGSVAASVEEFLQDEGEQDEVYSLKRKAQGASRRHGRLGFRRYQNEHGRQNQKKRKAQAEQTQEEDSEA